MKSELADINYYRSENDDLMQFLGLYLTAFPDNERRQEWRRVSDVAHFLAEHKEMNILIARLKGEFVGFLSYWNFQEFVYVEHFAILESFRDNGIGTHMLSYVGKQINNNIILEVELPVDATTVRRIAFYEKCGFRKWSDINYLQPPYSEGQQPVALMLMTHGNLPLSDENDLKIWQIKREVYGVDLY